MCGLLSVLLVDCFINIIKIGIDVIYFDNILLQKWNINTLRVSGINVNFI